MKHNAQKKQGLMFLDAKTSPFKPEEGMMRAGPKLMRCAIGKNGIGVKKNEGDGITPRGRFKLLDVYMRFDRLQKHSCAIKIKRVQEDMGWCDEPGNPNYNKPVRLPFEGSHEKLMREDGLYDIIIVLDYNIRRRRSSGGSAIFMHIAEEGYKPTEGCIAISKTDMAWLIPRISNGCVINIG